MPVAMDDEGTTVVLGVVEDGSSSELAPEMSPVLTSDDESEDSARGGDIREDTHGALATSGVGPTVGG